jgi:RNA-directed DNA polymerase
LVEKFLRQGVLESAKEWEPTNSGTPQGAVISPLLANIYLDPLDHTMARHGWKMVRYADDFVLLCHSEAEAHAVLAEVRQWVEEAGLTLHPEKTRLVNLAAGESFEFASLRSPLRGSLRLAVSLRSALGWHFERGHRWPREKSEQKLKEAVRQRTQRSHGGSLRQIIAGLNRVLRGWANYFRGGVRNVPVRLDQWVRMRVRSVVRRRAGRRGPARGKDHQRYANAWLTAQGLISLSAITHGAAPSPAKV